MNQTQFWAKFIDSLPSRDLFTMHNCYANDMQNATAHRSDSYRGKLNLNNVRNVSLHIYFCDLQFTRDVL